MSVYKVHQTSRTLSTISGKRKSLHSEKTINRAFRILSTHAPCVYSTLISSQNKTLALNIKYSIPRLNPKI